MHFFRVYIFHSIKILKITGIDTILSINDGKNGKKCREFERIPATVDPTRYADCIADLRNDSAAYAIEIRREIRGEEIQIIGDTLKNNETIVS